MTLSLNEIESKGKLAARGAGLSWGLAEEAGKAARWLASLGKPGPELLVRHLEQIDGVDHDDLAPVDTNDVWTSRIGQLCPLICGAALCDRANEIACGRTFKLGTTSCPALLVPYVAAASKLAGLPIGLTWTGVEIAVEVARVHIAGEEDAFLAAGVAGVHCRLASSVTESFEPGLHGRLVDADTCARLAVFEHRTYAPATERSRIAGAGSDMVEHKGG